MAQPKRFHVIPIQCTFYGWASRYGLGCIDPHNTTALVCPFFCSLQQGLQSPTTTSILSVSAWSITPPLRVSNECKTRICVMPTMFAMGENHCFVFLMLRRGLQSPTTVSSISVSAQSITPPLEVSNECKARICVMPTRFATGANNCFVFPIHSATNNKSHYLSFVFFPTCHGLYLFFLN